MKNGLAWAALGGAEPGSHSFHPLDANANVHVGWSHELLGIQSQVLAAMGDLRKVMEVVVEGALRGGRISEHDAVIGRKLAWILAGGNQPHATTLTEQQLLDLEREAFLSLCGERKTQERMAHTLKTGKPLRN